MKKCSKCKELKDPSKFFVDRRAKSGLSSQCKTCVSRTDTPRKKKERYLKYVYNLRLEEVEAMYDQQQGRCAICNVHKPSFNSLGGLVVDHCHTTGKVRSLLCTNCNTLLGRAEDKVEILSRAIAYLDWHKK